MQKRRTNNFFNSKWSVPLLGVLLILLLISTVKIHRMNKQTRIVKESIQKDYSILQEKHTDLESKLDKLSTDRGIEEELRDQYHVVQPGEDQVVIINNKPESVDISEKSWFTDFFH